MISLTTLAECLLNLNIGMASPLELSPEKEISYIHRLRNEIFVDSLANENQKPKEEVVQHGHNSLFILIF
jgi:hypothetical protein